MTTYSLGAAEDLTETIEGVVGKVTKGIGYVAETIAAVETLDDLRNGRTGKGIVHALDAVAGVVGSLGLFGAGISLVHGISRVFRRND